MPETFDPVVLQNDTGIKLNAAYFNRLENSLEVIDDRLATAELGAASTIVVVPYAATIALNATSGSLFRIDATGDIALQSPTGGLDDQLIRVQIRAHAANRTLTFPGTATSSLTIPAGGKWHGTLRYIQSGDTWTLTDWLEAAPGATTTPSAPSIGTASPGPGAGQVTVAFAAPSDDGGTAITSYTATSTPGGLTGTATTSPIIVSGLSSGVSYTFKVKATNSAGTGPESGASNPVDPAAPTNISFTAVAGVNQATATWSTTRTDITGWTVGRNGTDSNSVGPWSTTLGSAATTLTFTSLVAGTTYTLSLTPQTASGSLTALTAVVTPTSSATIPGSPTSVSATAGNAQATVAFTAPSNNGGAAITSYTATSTPGGLTGTGAGSPLTVTGLTNGTAYTFTVKATNSVGTGTESAASNPVTPTATANITFTATAGAGQVLAAWSTSRSDITGWLVGRNGTDTTGGGPWSTTDPASATSRTFDKLIAGTLYAFTLTPQTAAGALSALTATATPTAATVPGAPTIGTATAGAGQATVAFTAPSNNGGATITSYTATSSPGSITGTSTSSPVVVTGLTGGTAYTFTVRATNSVGTGSPSAASNSVTPTAGGGTANTLVGWSTIGLNELSPVQQEVFGQFMGRNNWTTLRNADWLGLTNPSATTYKNTFPNGAVCYGVPLIPHDSGRGYNTEFDEALAGMHDSDYVQMGASLTTYTPKTCYARIWWEFNLNGPEPTRFVNTWRRAIPLIRQGFANAAPTKTLKISWCYLTSNANPVPYWPGGAYVDIVAADIYGKVWAQTNPSVSQMINEVTGQLNELTAYGQTYGKPVAIEEWANCTPKGGSAWDTRGCGDCPEYINLVFDWAASANAEYLVYFGEATGAGVGTTLTATPNSLAAFKTRAQALQA